MASRRDPRRYRFDVTLSPTDAVKRLHAHPRVVRRHESAGEDTWLVACHVTTGQLQLRMPDLVAREDYTLRKSPNADASETEPAGGLRALVHVSPRGSGSRVIVRVRRDQERELLPWIAVGGFALVGTFGHWAGFVVAALFTLWALSMELGRRTLPSTQEFGPHLRAVLGDVFVPHLAERSDPRADPYRRLRAGREPGDEER